MSAAPEPSAHPLSREAWREWLRDNPRSASANDIHAQGARIALAGALDRLKAAAGKTQPWEI